MKQRILMLAFITLSAACANAQIKAPIAVRKAFETKFATATDVKWGKENKNEYEADFKMDGKKYSANFLTDGSWKETEAQIETSELPPAVATAYKSKHSIAAIKMAAKIESVNGQTKYEIEYKDGNKTKEVLFDENGKAAKE
ncbi:MAG: PepSY-like domain-containing protein [Ferruginibacter sp.]